MPTCGSCKFGRVTGADLKVRECHGVPPTPVLMPTRQGPAPIAVRPTVGVNDLACHLHVDKSDKLMAG
jgi:hypothetical protein